MSLSKWWWVWSHAILFVQKLILYSLTTKKSPKLCITGPLCWESTTSDGFPAQRASSAEIVSMSWYHHAVLHHLHARYVGQPSPYILFAIDPSRELWNKTIQSLILKHMFCWLYTQMTMETLELIRQGFENYHCVSTSFICVSHSFAPSNVHGV